MQQRLTYNKHACNSMALASPGPGLLNTLADVEVGIRRDITDTHSGQTSDRRYEVAIRLPLTLGGRSAMR
jgi:hypothetical protein